MVASLKSCSLEQGWDRLRVTAMGLKQRVGPGCPPTKAETGRNQQVSSSDCVLQRRPDRSWRLGS